VTASEDGGKVICLKNSCFYFEFNSFDEVSYHVADHNLVGDPPYVGDEGRGEPCQHGDHWHSDPIPPIPFKLLAKNVETFLAGRSNGIFDCEDS